jgi:hypothetical protein
MPEPLLVGAPLLIAAIVMAVRFVGCGIDDSPLPNGDTTGDGPGDDNPKPVKVNASFTGNGIFSATAGFPGMGDVTEDHKDGAGTYSFLIPYWCDTIDLLLLGAGGGGTYAEFNTGGGGGAGS